MTVEFATTKIGRNFNQSKIALVEKFIVHDEFDGNYIRNDIALIKLKEPIDTGLYGSPVKLAMPGSDFRTGTSGTVAGWGRFGSGLALSPLLQKVDLQIYSFDDCKAAHSTGPMADFVLPTNICAGAPEMGKAECNGDSGELG